MRHSDLQNVSVLIAIISSTDYVAQQYKHTDTWMLDKNITAPFVVPLSARVQTQEQGFYRPFWSVKMVGKIALWLSSRQSCDRAWDSNWDSGPPSEDYWLKTWYMLMSHINFRQHNLRCCHSLSHKEVMNHAAQMLCWIQREQMVQSSLKYQYACLYDKSLCMYRLEYVWILNTLSKHVSSEHMHW
jgi:hypothetical protein